MVGWLSLPSHWLDPGADGAAVLAVLAFRWATAGLLLVEAALALHLDGLKSPSSGLVGGELGLGEKRWRATVLLIQGLVLSCVDLLLASLDRVAKVVQLLSSSGCRRFWLSW